MRPHSDAKLVIYNRYATFYAPDITPPLYTLSEEESKHCVRVLRLGRGDTLHITDGRGNLFCCQITDATRNDVRFASPRHRRSGNRSPTGW